MALMDIEGRTALVTGGAHGIGLACVKQLLSNGVKVSICDVDEARGLAALEKLSSEFGPDRVIFIRTDVTNEAEFEEAFKKTIASFKSLDIVFNNAGIIGHENWRRMIDINVTAVVTGTKLAFKYMGRHEGGAGGVVCVTASIAGLMPVGSMPVYAATKYAVVGLVRSYGQPYHLEKTGVRVVAICPGVTETALFNDITSGQDEVANHVSEDLARVPSQSPEDVARAMMVVLRTAPGASVWVCLHGTPLYEVRPQNIMMSGKTE